MRSLRTLQFRREDVRNMIAVNLITAQESETGNRVGNLT
jgi:hypothetical protein